MSYTELYESGMGDAFNGVSRRFYVTPHVNGISACKEVKLAIAGENREGTVPTRYRTTHRLDQMSWIVEVDYAVDGTNFSPGNNPDNPINDIRILEMSFQKALVPVPTVLVTGSPNGYDQVRAEVEQPVRQTSATVRVTLNDFGLGEAQAITAQQGKFHQLTPGDNWLFEGADVNQVGPAAYRYTYQWTVREVLAEIPEFFTVNGSISSRLYTPRALQPFEQVRATIFPSLAGEQPPPPHFDYWFAPTPGDPSGLPGAPV